jgi:putative membrane protein
MGAADVVPGVSGGTMALILGVYERLLRSIARFDLRLLSMLARRRIGEAVEHIDFVFLCLLGAGIIAAVGFFTRVVPLPELIRTHPVEIYSLFFGLIVGSIVIMVRHLDRIVTRDIALIVLGALIGWRLVSLVPATTPNDAWFVALSGGIAICAMLLPGVSGSFLLLMLRKYAYVLEAIGQLKMAVLVPFGLGAAVGLLVFSRVLRWLLDRYRRATYLTIIGLLIGSLWVVWPFQERIYESTRGKLRLVHSTPVFPEEVGVGIVLPALLCIAGIGAVVWLERRARSGSRAAAVSGNASD